MNCINCGLRTDPSDSFCGSCGAPVQRVADEADSGDGIFLGAAPTEDVPATYVAPAPVMRTTDSVPANRRAANHIAAPVQQHVAPADSQGPRFCLAQGEEVLKTYETVVLRPGLLRRKRGHGTLYVTDARVVFYAWVYPRGTQRQSWLFQQTKLEDISGLSAIVSRRFSLGLLVLTLSCGLATLGTLVTLLLPLTFLFAIATALFAALLIWDAARRGSVRVLIQSRGTNNSPIYFGHEAHQGIIDTLVRSFMFPILLFFPTYNAADVAAGDPGQGADRMLHELGALILDLQTRGTMAYPYWGITPTAGIARAVDVQ